MSLRTLLYFFLFLLPLGAMGDEPMVVQLDANESPPYWSSQLPNDGLGGEIVQAISKAAGIKSEIKYFPLKRLIEDDSNNDLGNPQFYLDAQDFGAIVPIAVYNVSVFYYKPHFGEEIQINHIKDLSGYKVGLLKGTLIDRAYFRTAGIDVEESYNQDSLIKKLKHGRIDFCIEIDLVGHQSIQTLFPDEIDNFSEIILPRSSSPIAILLDEDYPSAKALGLKYKKGLEAIIENGRYQEILDRYYGVHKVPENWYRELKKFGIVYSDQESE